MTTTTTVTNISYTGTIQNATVTSEFGIPVNAYLWGGGGGSAGQGNGNAGGYSKVFFIAKPGDMLTIAVGQGGGRGGTNINPWTPSGFPGAAYSGLLFNTRFPPPGQDAPVVPYGQRFKSTGNGLTSFLAQWGVWGADQNIQTFTRTYTINFPATANVIFQMVASSYGRVYVDGILVVEGGGRSPNGVSNDTINQAFVRVTAGNHTITIQANGSGAPANPNSDNPNAIGVTFGTGDQTTYSGGRGGQSDNDRGIQAAGGGGGATVLSLNGVIIGVAAGGAGAATRPAVSSSTDYRYTNGQDGQDLNGFYGQADAGPGGGGGGGYFAGQGGTAGPGAPNAGGIAGVNGTSLGDAQSQTVGQVPYINNFYPGNNVAFGGQGQGYYSSGGNGSVALEYQTGGGGYIKDGGQWSPVQTTYVKDAGAWKQVQTTYIKDNGVWKPVQGAPVPSFTQFYGAFATGSRSFGSQLQFTPPPPPPPPPAPDYSSSWNNTGYGSFDVF